MARPKKQTVDYFPHQCVHGKTLFILEKNYGNNGYAFWFKLLELLGSTEGHYLDLKDDSQKYFLSAKTFVNDEISIEILNLLSKLEAIDKELWEEKQIIWSQNFIDNIKDAYRNRTEEIPIRPSFLRKKPNENNQSDVINPQTKLKKTKVNNTKENKHNSDELLIIVEIDKIENSELKISLKSFFDSRHNMKKPMTKNAYDLLLKKLSKFNIDLQIEALNEAVINGWQSIYPKENKKGKGHVVPVPDWMEEHQKYREEHSKKQEEEEELPSDEELKKLLQSFK